MAFDLERFVAAQDGVYESALRELRAGGWTRLESGSSGIEIYRRDRGAQLLQANAK